MNSKALRARLPSSDLSIPRKSLIPFSIPVLALVVCAGLFGYPQQEDSVVHGWVKHTLKVHERIQDVGKGERVKRIEVPIDEALVQIDRLYLFSALFTAGMCARGRRKCSVLADQ